MRLGWSGQGVALGNGRAVEGFVIFHRANSRDAQGIAEDATAMMASLNLPEP